MNDPESFFERDYITLILRISAIIFLAEITLIFNDNRLLFNLLIFCIIVTAYLLVDKKNKLLGKYHFEELPALMAVISSPFVYYNTLWNLAGIFIFYIFKENIHLGNLIKSNKIKLLLGNIALGIVTSAVLTLIYSSLKVLPFYFLKYLN